MLRPKISIIVPVYNVQKYLRDCLDSLLNQTFKEYEIILIDDGSTDISGEICDEYAKNNDKIKVIHKENGGLSSARNAGIEIAKGNFLGFVDSDDWIDKDMYKELYFNIKNTTFDIIACNFYIMDAEGNFEPYTKNAMNQAFNRELALKELISNNTLTFSSCNKLYKRELFEDLRYEEGIILEDMDLSYQIFNKANNIFYLNKPLYFYRYNSSSILRNSFSLKRIDEYFVRKKMYEFYLKVYPELSDLLYYHICCTGSRLYTLVSVNLNENLTEYKFLINYNNRILIRLLKNKELRLKDKLKILLFLVSPRFDIFIRKLMYKN